ncbi:hypothetical protein [Faecalicatena contorta]|uniref:hypothetical protein n=1 Tax=Faecalicatena contorta TaxID=39482 RepID=UPI001F1838AA|nr:hypothetical protein [Faecalicatena contorta]MCF2555146.1 hypothetical protein [Faecalicatena contorta]
MKKTGKKRVIAGTMAVLMAATLAGTYGYQHSSMSRVEAEDEVKELKDAAQDIMGDTDAPETDGLYKDESVYVKADAGGNVTDTTVTEWLKNPGEGKVTDQSILQDIKNIKGEETFEVNADGDVIWNAAGKDIYYQGTTDGELPISVKISYKLDGKEISAEDLKGKDGKVEIHISYENHAKEMVSVNGSETEMYTPFTMVTAMMLPTDEYQNVEIDNGKIISDADKDIVVGLGFPGLRENLNLQDLDIDIPDSFTITADVKNASVGPTITLASSEILSEFGLDDVDDFDSLEDSVGALEDAAGKLTDGSKELADGANMLDEKTSELKSGVNELKNGVDSYVGGVAEIADGSTRILAGMDTLKQGAYAAQAGIQSAKAGADQLLTGYDDAENGAVAGARKLSQGLNDLNREIPDTALNSVAINAVASALAEQATRDIPDEAFEEMDTTKAAYKTALAEGYASALQTKLADPVNKQVATIKGNVSDLATGADNLSAGMGKLRDGTANLQGGLSRLCDGSDTLVGGSEQLYSAVSQLQKGASRLNESSSLLKTGAGKLADGAGQFGDGVGQLADGANTLSGGMEEFKISGIDKLAEVFHGDIQNATSRIEAMTTLGKNYRSFAGIGEDVEGSTKFIIETKGVD